MKQKSQRLRFTLDSSPAHCRGIHTRIHTDGQFRVNNKPNSAWFWTFEKTNKLPTEMTSSDGPVFLWRRKSRTPNITASEALIFIVVIAGLSVV